jgi:hypothetical protein
MVLPPLPITRATFNRSLYSLNQCRRATSVAQELTLVPVRAQFERLQDTFMNWVTRWTEELKMS